MADQNLSSFLWSVADLLPVDERSSASGNETVLKQPTNRILETIGGLSG